MDKATAQAAFQCADLAGKVTFEWPSATVMKVVPTTPLVYAQGKHAELATLAAKVYSITLNTSAKDQAGNALGGAYLFKFSTLRRVSWSTFTSINGEAYALSSAGTMSQGSLDAGIWVGDADDDSWNRMAVQFDLSSIPSHATGVAAASFSVPMTLTASWTGKPLGFPFAKLGKVVVQHIETPKIDANTLLLEPLRLVGDLATTGTAGIKTVDATEAVAEDLARRAQRGNRSQFRAQFTKTTDGKNSADAVVFGYDDGVTLSADYLIP